MDLSKLIKVRDSQGVTAPRPLHITFASSEVAPFSKTGGLGDVAASLPKALARRGHQVTIITPLYKHLDAEKMRLSRRLQTLEVPRKSKSQNKAEAVIWEARLDSGVRICFLENEEYFGRDGLYGYDERDFEDNAERFAFFSRAVVEHALQLGTPVDIIHCNDWHTALAPVYRNQFYAKELRQVPTILTLHNLAYQGTFPKKAMSATGLPKKYESTTELLAEDNKVNFLKGGLLHTQAITAVSPTYAEEIRTESGGFGLHEVLEQRKDELYGILNGADYSIWSPDIDRHIEVRYEEATLNGKRQNKARLQHSLGLPVRPTLPVLALISRLTEQKGLDILLPALKKLLKSFTDEQEGFQFIALGDGNNKYRVALEKLAKEYPRRVAFHPGYNEELAHQFQAGADIMLVPSRFEPCGLTQIYAMRYGTLPIVHATGGLADTVVDASSTEEESSGFVFDDYSAKDLQATIERATTLYRNYRRWRPMMMTAMKKDFSWDRSALKYEEVYYKAIDSLQKKKK